MLLLDRYTGKLGYLPSTHRHTNSSPNWKMFLLQNSTFLGKSEAFHETQKSSSIGNSEYSHQSHPTHLQSVYLILVLILVTIQRLLIFKLNLFLLLIFLVYMIVCIGVGKLIASQKTLNFIYYPFNFQLPKLINIF